MTIKEIQSALKDEGYYKGKVDGAWGKVSRKALKAFQQDAGLTPDGFYGAKTEQALFYKAAPIVWKKLDDKMIAKAVTSMFSTKRFGKEFVNELARLLHQFGGEFKINKRDRLARFLAHVVAEVDARRGRAKMREGMNYTEKRLKSVFKTMRHHPKWASKYGRNSRHGANQKMIANIVYAHRLGNRDIASGDGWRYRGAGILQSTGRATIKKDLRTIEKLTGMTLINPKTGEAFDGELDTYTVGILLGMANWYGSRMWKAKTFEKTIDIINYYTDSRKKRRKLYAKAKGIIGVG